MNRITTTWRSVMLCAAALLTLVHGVQAAITDLASAPLETSSPTLVKPNIFFVLDDSGSMTWDFLPDFVGYQTSSTISTYRSLPGLMRNSAFNKVYYNPATYYAPPLKFDGSSYPSMTSTQTTGWKQVPYDGFGTQKATGEFTTSNAGYVNVFTSTTSGTTQDLTSAALYYVFSPGEYCSDFGLRNCTVQSAPTTANPYPANLRWCSDTALTDCQAVRIDTAPSGGKTYTNARYPGLQVTPASGSTATVVVSTVSGNVSVSGITVNGLQIMSAGTGNQNNKNNLATAIATAINNCTTTKTGSCGTTGYSASTSGATVTITAPATGPITDTPLPNKSGSVTLNTTAFTGGANAASVPGQNVLTTISSSTTTYARASTRTDCESSTTSCSYAEEMTNFANWWAYYRTRMQMTKSAATLGFSALTTSYRLGYMSIDNNTTSDFLDIADITTTTGGQKDKWYQKLIAAKPGNGTPLRAALSTAGQYYAGKLTKVNGQTAGDPMQYACQRNYTLLSTDGYWNKGTENYKKVDGTTDVGDQDSASSIARPYLDGTATSNTLADVAQYYYTTDIRASILGTDKTRAGVDISTNDTLNGQQRMYTYTIGLGVSGYMQYRPDYQSATSGDYYDVLKGTTASSSNCRWQTSGACNWPTAVGDTQTAVDDLWHAAANGRGTYYSAGDPVALKDGITGFLKAVDAQNSAGAAVTPSTANVTSTDKYLFDSNFFSVQWAGELARYTINPATGVPGVVNATTGALDVIPDWTQSGTASTTSATQPTPLLDEFAYTSRKIYTYDPSNATDVLVPFAWGSLSDTMKNYFMMASIKSLSQVCASGTNCVPSAQQIDSTTAGTNTGMGGINLVNFLRGDRSNEGSAGGKYFFKRTHVLGDIVGSQTSYVKRSTFNYPDTGYAAFKTTNESRQGMVYVGANDGMLHAFNADTGAEAWSYIPSMLLPKMYKLADRNYDANHTYFVNGSPQQGDVYFDGAWHTILVGGLAAGGRGFYALDVTSPGTSTTPLPPKVLWEFTFDTSKGAPYISDQDLGYSYGIPIITKLSDGTWVVIVSSGYNNVSPGDGGGHLWVLNAKTGAIIKKIDTGVGSATAVVAGSGCTVAPCPSGLSRISAWMDNVNINNTVTQVYSGDLYGNVWRFDLSKLTATGGTASVQLLATLQDASNNPQPITSWIELGFTSNSHIVYVGTGSYLGVTDISTTQVQSIYAIKDPLTTSTATGGLYGSPRATACSATLKTNCFMKQVFTDSTSGVRTVSSSMSFATNLGAMNGWFIDLPNTGERINTDSTLQLGILVFVSNIPNNSNACGTGGSAYLNFIDYKTGLTVRTTTTAGVLLASGNGLGSAPAVLSTPSGKLIASVKLSTGQRVDAPLPPGAGGTGTRRVSWRELITH